MTERTVKMLYKKMHEDENERIVDVFFYGRKNEYVAITTISKNHVIWRNEYKIKDKSLSFIDTKVLV